MNNRMWAEHSRFLKWRVGARLADKTRSLVQHDREQALADSSSYCRNTARVEDHRPRVRYCPARDRLESTESHVANGTWFRLSLPMSEVRRCRWIHRAASKRSNMHRRNAEALLEQEMGDTQVYGELCLLADLYLAWSYELAMHELHRQGILRD